MYAKVINSGVCRMSMVPQLSPFENARTASVCVKRLRAQSSLVIRPCCNNLQKNLITNK